MHAERHYQRADRLLQQASLVDYMWQTVRVAESEASAKRTVKSKSKADSKKAKWAKKSKA